MPELPEVEVVRRGLEALAGKKQIKEVWVLTPGVVGHPSVEKFIALLRQKQIISFDRHGKYLIVYLNNYKLVIHLRMTGVLTCEDQPPPLESRHMRMVILLQDGGTICFYDQRKFGKVWLLQTGEEDYAGINRLGPDWLNEANWELFKERLKSRKRARIKNLLLDQSFMAGLGNIYTDESLYRAGIHPSKRAGELSSTQLYDLYHAIIQTLKEGIEQGGTSFSNYLNTTGEEGGYQNSLSVYRRKGQSCQNCGSIIQKIILGGRGTHFCPNCQDSAG